MKKNLKIAQVHDLPSDLDAKTVYVLSPKNFSQAYYDERTDRNIGWITKEEQELLHKSVVGIAGCGGMGGLIAATLLRLGVGEIRIADIEVFDRSNLNRQFAATQGSIGKSKAFETAKMLRAIVEDTTLIVYPQGITEETIESFTLGCDVICDEIEFWALGARVLLHQKARELGISIFNCNTVGFGTRLFLFKSTGMTMEKLLGFTYEEAKETEHALRTKIAKPALVKRAMDSVIKGLIPEAPEYSPNENRYSAILGRLFNEGKASIIATNPPMASGFLCDHILFYLLRQSKMKRQITEIPEIPGYLFLDAAKMEARQVFLKSTEHRNNPKIIIGLAKSEIEKREAEVFVNRKYLELFKTLPPTAQYYFVAKHNEEIIGTLSLDFCLETDQIWLEKIYQFDHATAPLPVLRDKIAQYGRWITAMSGISGISEGLLYSATVYAEKHGRLYGWCEQKDKSYRVAKRLGIIFYPVPNAKLLLENMPPETQVYYSTPPPMKLFMASLPQARKALEPRVRVLMECGQVSFVD